MQQELSIPRSSFFLAGVENLVPRSLMTFLLGMYMMLKSLIFDNRRKDSHHKRADMGKCSHSYEIAFDCLLTSEKK